MNLATILSRLSSQVHELFAIRVVPLMTRSKLVLNLLPSPRALGLVVERNDDVLVVKVILGSC